MPGWIYTIFVQFKLFSKFYFDLINLLFKSVVIFKHRRLFLGFIFDFLIAFWSEDICVSRAVAGALHVCRGSHPRHCCVRMAPPRVADGVGCTAVCTRVHACTCLEFQLLCLMGLCVVSFCKCSLYTWTRCTCTAVGATFYMCPLSQMFYLWCTNHLYFTDFFDYVYQ